MRKILFTGATGNVGQATLPHLLNQIDAEQTQILGGIRLNSSDANLLPAEVYPVAFDFGNPACFAAALLEVHTLFLLRPPQLANVQKTFAPLIAAAQSAQVQHIVFLSVQGVAQSSLIPHYGIEKLICESGIAYTFLRPAYFMQNFTTTLLADLQKLQRVYLPAGEAKFTLVDLADVGRVAAQVLLNPEKHQNQAYDLTNLEQLTFEEMAAKLSAGLGKKITFVSPNLWQFFWQKRREKVPTMLILVMIMLHFLPRFRPTPPTSASIEQITGQMPQTFEQFISHNRHLFDPLANK
ncbi:MAG TPA: NmrA family transcriptional regulator [Microscillaceae bacterium]|nr:NmrA family transcriptional regulator [Microscillaceae bacterium]